MKILLKNLLFLLRKIKKAIFKECQLFLFFLRATIEEHMIQHKQYYSSRLFFLNVYPETSYVENIVPFSVPHSYYVTLNCFKRLMMRSKESSRRDSLLLFLWKYLSIPVLNWRILPSSNSDLVRFRYWAKDNLI